MTNVTTVIRLFSKSVLKAGKSKHSDVSPVLFFFVICASKKYKISSDVILNRKDTI